MHFNPFWQCCNMCITLPVVHIFVIVLLKQNMAVLCIWFFCYCFLLWYQLNSNVCLYNWQSSARQLAVWYQKKTMLGVLLPAKQNLSNFAWWQSVLSLTHLCWHWTHFQNDCSVRKGRNEAYFICVFESVKL